MIKANDVINLLEPDNADLKRATGKEYLTRMIRAISELALKLKEPDKQSLYFRRGLESRQDDLLFKVLEFNNLKEHINNSSLADFDSEIRYAKDQLAAIKATGSMSFHKSLAKRSYENRINNNTLFISIKHDIGQIKELWEYLD